MPFANSTEEIIQPTDQVDTRRDQIMASMDAIESADPVVIDDGGAAQRARDESGRFAPKPADAPAAAPAPVVATPAAQAAPQPAEAPSLTTWRKEYLPIQQKLSSGQALTPDEAQRLAAYNVQREKEYSTGVSTYKAEAQQAQHLKTAVDEFLPTLQRHGMDPAQWITNMGRAHHTLAMGTPEQKLQMFTNLARDYNVPLGMIQQAQQGGVDPVAMQLMAEVQRLQQSVTGVTSWREQQEMQAIQQELSKFADTERYPHFEQVRGSMAQLLESGVAQNPDEAYTKAVRLDDTVFTAEQARQASAGAAAQEAARQAALKKAKNAGASVRSATPSGMTAAPTAKDRRGALASAFEAADAGRV